MTESFLHYLWEYQYFHKHSLQTTHGDEIRIFHTGQRNTHSGPDFFNARIQIGEMNWVGSVEIHVHASGWLEHKHHLDPAYENVVLHVVWDNDKAIRHEDGSWLPTLELKDRVSGQLFNDYKKLLTSAEVIPCSKRFREVTAITRMAMLDRVLVERLEMKATQVLQMLQRNNNDWEETCYQLLLKNFGFKVNNEPFLQLAQAVPYKLLLKHADSQIQLEALLFGQAGFLEEENRETYYRLLKREYKILSQKYRISEKKLKKVQWRFLRLRPANFPTMRIAQVAALVFRRRNFFSAFTTTESVSGLTDFFSVSQSVYWLHHYRFFKAFEEEITSLGEASIDNVIINTVVPVMVAYGKSRDEQVYVDRAVCILQDIHAEINKITNHWKSLGMHVKTAFDSQASVELYNSFCVKRRCLDCTIGAYLLNPNRK